MHQPKPQTIEKYKAVQQRYKELYEKKRVRHDDVLAALCKEFFLSESRIGFILKQVV